ncbi:MAG: right-handed parallel beta-helix repeat-containing protein [Elusimicrobia bacterium]|nr:right-handed parallel beta-helix repeat-containing protein [Elusimicrobiota bacterium]
MFKPNFKFFYAKRFLSLFILGGALLFSSLQFAYCQTDDSIFDEPSHPPIVPILKDSTVGQGKEFSIVTIEGSTIALVSDKVIEVSLCGLKKAIMLYLERTDASSSVRLSFSGLMPSTTYTIREDGIEKLDIVSSSDGEITYDQDITEPHSLFIHSERNTVYIRPDGSIDPPTAPITSHISGTYFELTDDLNEPLVIQRDNISFNGDGHSIIGAGQALGVDISGRSGVSVWYLTVKGFYAGIRFSKSKNCNLRYSSIIANTSIGVMESGGDNNLYQGNIVKNQVRSAYQMSFSYAKNIVAKENNIAGEDRWIYSGRGIDLYKTDKSVFTRNKISHTGDSVFLSKSYGNEISFSTFTDNVFMHIYWGENIIKNNLFEWNWVGISLASQYDPYYLSEPGNGGINIIEENIIRYSQFAGITSGGQNALIRNNVLNSNYRGIELRPGVISTGSNTIINNNFGGNTAGIMFYGAEGEIISKNNFAENDYGFTDRYAIVFHSGSKNTIKENRINNASYYGLYMAGGDDNVISENTIINDSPWSEGMRLSSTLTVGNTIYHNNFIGANLVNTVNAGKNYWNVAYSTIGGGNYYSDHIAPDVAAGPMQNLLPPIVIPDNIIDTPRIFDANNIDEYPFKLEDGWKKPIQNENEYFSQIAVSTDDARCVLISDFPDTTISLITVDAPHGFKVEGSAYKLTDHIFGHQGGLISFIYDHCDNSKPPDADVNSPIQKCNWDENFKKCISWDPVLNQICDQEAGTVSAFIPSSSIFALFEPLDNLPPRTVLNISEPQYANAFTYISSETALSFTAEDDAFEIGDNAGIGVDKTYFAVDIDTFSIYAQAFSIIDEGTRTVKFFSIDKLGNAEIIKSSIVAIDNTPPITEFLVNGATVQEPIVAFETDYFGFKADDPISNNINSGLERTEFTIDDNLFSIYSATFSLTLGTHIISFGSIDNVENTEELKTISVKIIPPLLITLDLNPDTLNLKSQGQYVTAYIEVSGTKATEDIEPPTIKIISINDELLSTPIALVQETAGKSGKLKFAEIGDYDEDGIADLMVKFDRQSLINVLPIGEQVEITLQGKFKDDEEFTAQDYIRTILPGNISASLGGNIIHASKAKIKISQNALAMDTDITILKISKEPKEKENAKKESAEIKNIKQIGKPYEFGPEGLKFNKPVEISLPYTAAEISADEENRLKIAYWNPDINDWEILNSAIDKTNKIISAETNHFSIYQIVSTNEPLQSQSDFKFGEIYAFPNPAKRGTNPTLHIEAGIADKIDINIYDVSGQMVKSATLTNSPQLIDDGQGLQYAYEWTWDVSNIGSGIYIYIVTAHKSGYGSLKAIKKVGIIK